MYAVLFDLDTNCLNENYDGATYHNSYKLVKDFMIESGFTWTQGSVYFGGDKIDAEKSDVIAPRQALSHDSQHDRLSQKRRQTDCHLE